MKLILTVVLLMRIAVSECYRGEKDFSSIKLNDRPIIAILAQKAVAFPGYSYIAASYVKYLESAGARVVPILETFSEDEVKEIFQYVNGVLLPGGNPRKFNSTYFRNAKIAYDKSINVTSQDYFPIWGTCLGYEALNVITSNTTKVITLVHAEDMSVPLHFTKEARSSRMFKDMPIHLYKAVARDNLTYNNHVHGVTTENHRNNPEINAFYKVLTTNIGRNGKEFVSSMEAYEFPIYGVQFHSEKNAFEFTTESHVSHSKEAVDVSYHLASLFVNEARKNKQRFPSHAMEEEYMIYKYKMVHTGVRRFGLHLHEQAYLFKL